MLKVLFSARPPVWEEYELPLNEAFDAAGLEVDLSQNHPANEVDYIVFAPNGPVEDFSPYTRTKCVMSLWAGVETVVENQTLTQPLARMVDHGLTRGMTEWVVGHTMRHHLGMDLHLHGQDGVWRDTVYPPLAVERPVTVLGLGALGTASAIALRDLGFPVTGWSRGAKDIAGVRCLSGSKGLETALTGAQVVILLLPMTPLTRNILNAERLALLGQGAVVLNPGRGPMIDDDALLAALEEGQLAHATLDVFRQEPLPPTHPFWAHPKVTVTPHIASTTRPRTAAQAIAANIARGEAGKPFLHLVDHSVGY